MRDNMRTHTHRSGDTLETCPSSRDGVWHPHYVLGLDLGPSLCSEAWVETWNPMVEALSLTYNFTSWQLWLGLPGPSPTRGVVICPPSLHGSLELGFFTLKTGLCFLSRV